MNKKIISFSLYGTKQMYQDGAVENSFLVKKFYQEWECRFYVSQEIPTETIEQLKKNGSTVIYKERVDEVDGTFWRFLPMSESDLEVLIVRDVDSRISQREVDAVNDWIKSKKKFHIMRDHPGHIILIPAGMFGIKGQVIKNIENLIESWKQKRENSGLGWANEYGLDQLFLAQEIYPKIKKNVLIHSELVKFFGEKVTPFPSKRMNNDYVGQVINRECDESSIVDLTALSIKNYLPAVFYYNDKFIKLFTLIKKIRMLFKRGQL